MQRQGIDKGMMTFYEALAEITKAKNILYDRMYIKTQALEMKLNGRVNKFLRSCLLEQIESIGRYIEEFNEIEQDIKDYVVEYKLNMFDKAGVSLTQYVLDITISAREFEKTAS